MGHCRWHDSGCQLKPKYSPRNLFVPDHRLLNSRIPLVTLLCVLGLVRVPLLHADEPLPGPSGSYDESVLVNWLQSRTLEDAIPGGTFAIVTREGVTHLQTFGVKSVDTHASITQDSIFRLASVSKTFAGTAAAILVDQHLQDWNSPLSDLIPGLTIGTDSSSRTITLKQVVSHSTGLMPHSYSNLLDAGVNYDKIRGQFDQIPTVCAPGKCYGYQNVVFSLVADVVEVRTGASYEKYIEEQLFKPLGMTTASIGLEPYELSVDATVPHSKVRGDWRPTTTNAAYYSVAPASGVNASINDMTLWVRANLGAFPDVLSPEQLANLHEPIIATPHGNYFNRWSGMEKAYYATGWRVFDYRGLRAIHHGGGVRGYRSEVVFVPERNIGMVLMLNAESNLANDVVPAFLDSLLDSH
ncbi:MAG: class A beta-lactamase-related serine hydrolase [Gammaproteobacteria bacterium]|nr:class A beta-lactamase-related serine hydrolase [Gammaproteobacteria bacterium]